MAILIGVLVAVAVALALTAVMELLAAREREVVLERLEQLRLPQAHDGRGPGRRGEVVRHRATGLLRSLGERFVANRSNVETLRGTLVQAGYRGAGALPMYFAVRMVLMIALALVGLFVVRLISPAPAAPLFAMPYFVLVGWFAPRFWLGRRVAARKAELQRALPDTLDLMVVGVEAGLGLNQALLRVANEIEQVSVEMSSELKILNLEIQAGTARDEAFRNLGTRTGVEDLQSLAAMLIQADRFGTSVAQALRIQAETLRLKRRQRAEEEAAKTTIKLVFPLVLFIFPALFVIILGPALLSILTQMGGN